MAFDRATYQREYMREYMRRRRAAERQATPPKPKAPKPPTYRQAVESVFLYVRDNPGISADDAARELGLTAEMLKDVLTGLQETGKLYVHALTPSRQFLYIED